MTCRVVGRSENPGGGASSDPRPYRGEGLPSMYSCLNLEGGGGRLPHAPSPGSDGPGRDRPQHFCHVD